MVLHFLLSIVYAPIFALVIHRPDIGAALALDATGGLVLYLVNFYGFTALFPWFAMARNWISIFAHIVFGATAAGVHVTIRKHHLQEESHAGGLLPGEEGLISVWLFTG